MSVTRSSAPELTSEQVAKVLVQPLAETSKFLAAGPVIYDTTGPFRIPKVNGMVASGTTTPATPDWIGESELITEKDIDFTDVSLLPSTMKSLKTIVRVSNEMLRASVVSLSAAIQNRLVVDVANRLDAQLLSAGGDGVSTPRGLFNYTGTQSVAVGGALTLDVLLDGWGKALDANVNLSTLKWVMRGREFVRLRKVKDTNGQYLLQPDPTKDGVFRLWGSEVVISNKVPDTTAATPTARAALVDFGSIAVARDMAPSVVILNERFAEYDEAGLRIVCRYDAKPVTPEGIIVFNGITI
ncbi:MAG: capsid protein [Marmoricola sp.]|nr:capsid protein [Marmoricola sp.]